MIDSERGAFAAMLSPIYELHGKELSPGLLSLWWYSLERYSLADVRKALSAQIVNPDSGQFLPKPADVIRHIEGTTQTRGLTAWSKVEKAIRSVGTYATVTFDDPAIMAAIRDMGGWIELCRTSEKEMPFKAQEFTKRHAGYVAKPPKEFPAKLTGVAEAENLRSGFSGAIPEPVMIGNKQAASLVYERGMDAPQNLIHRAEKSIGAIAHQTLPATKEFGQRLLPILAKKEAEDHPPLDPEVEESGNVRLFKPNAKRQAELMAELQSEMEKLDKEEAGE